MRAQKEDIQVRQGAIRFVQSRGANALAPFMAKVKMVYSDRLTCDIETLEGAPIPNVPVLTEGGLVDGAVYGTVDLPAVDDYVVVGYAGFSERHKVIIGTVVPYLVNAFTKDAVNSGNKQFTKKLLEADKPKRFLKIFKSGTTVEVEEDGTIIIEVPSGTYLKISEANDNIVIEDQHRNIVTMDSAGMNLTDKNGNAISMETGKVTINGNLEVLQ